MCSIVLKAEQLHNVCRVCMIKSDNLIDIFSSAFNSVIISNMLMDCTPVQISLTDQLPKCICDSCLERLEHSYRFRSLCIDSDENFRRILTSLQPHIKSENVDYAESYIKQENESTTDDNTKLSDDENLSVKFESIKIIRKRLKVKRTSRLKNEKNNVTKKQRIRKIGPRKEKILPGEDGFFSCKICTNKYKLKSSLVEHLIVHSEFRFRCDVCDKGFTRKMLLRTHEKVHTDERTHSCEFCGKTFRTASALRTHQRIHLQIRPYKCEICSRTFIQNKSLKNHMRTHTGERPFVCETCGRSFNRKHILKTHTMTHTGERPFRCDICNQGFICKQHLNLHKAKHSMESTSNYKCTI